LLREEDYVKTPVIAVLSLCLPLVESGQNAPEISPGGVVNAANYGPLIAPGGIISIFGTNLGQTQFLQTLPYPTKMGETSVTVNGETASLLFVSPTQVNALIPSDIPPGLASVVVAVGASATSPAVALVTPVAPAFFTAPKTGSGNAAAQHLDYSSVTDSSPAQVSEIIVVYATGLGPADTKGVLETPEVSIGGRIAEVIYAGQTIYPGLYQINVRVPNLVVGDQEIVVRMPQEDVDSSAGVTIPVFGVPLTGTQVSVKSEYFGLHMNSSAINGLAGVPWPAFSFGPVRLHDTVTKWADIDKGNGVYDFSKLDNLLSHLTKKGKTDLIFTIWGTPQYAAGGKTCTNGSGVTFLCVPPSDLNPDGTGPNQYWKNYITALANHAAGQKPGKIKYWEIWNESNASNYWTGTVQQLVTMARDAYTIIKKVDPQALILTPPVAAGAVSANWGGWSWLDQYFRAGGDQWTDIVAFHGYPYPKDLPLLPEKALDGIAKIASISPSGKRMWNTESSWGRNTDLPDANLQAAFAARTRLLLIGVVDRYYWYQYGNQGWGTLTNAKYALNPAGNASQQVYDWTVGSTFAAPCSPVSKGSTTWSCQLTRPGGYQAQIIWDTSLSCSGGTCPTIGTAPPPGMISYRDLGGSVYPINSGTSVKISAKPIMMANRLDAPSTAIPSPDALSFGDQVYQSASSPQIVTLTNSATTAMSINSIAITGANPGDFTQTNTCGSILQSNASCSIAVTFNPTGIGTRTGSLAITDNAPGSPQEVRLDGNGLSAISALSPTLTFPPTTVGTTSDAQTLTVVNSSSKPLAMKAFTFTGPNASDFQQTNDCGSSLAAGAGCSVSVTFTPAAAGPRSATLAISHGDPASPETIPLSGTGLSGPAVVLSPTSLAFGNVIYVKQSPPQMVTLTNSGNAALNIQSITITGGSASDFSQTNDCGTWVSGGASCTFTVTFRPKWTGARTASLQIVDNAAGSPHLVSLSGTGVVQFSISPASLTFSATTVGTSSSVQTVTVTNPIRPPASIGSIAVSGTNANDFKQTNTCTTSLDGLASCAINVTFTPAGVGSRSAILSITDGDPTSPQTIPLSGTGLGAPAVVLSPTSLDFGNVIYVKQGAPQMVTLTNSGNAALNIQSIAITGGSASDFSQSNDCGDWVSGGASCTFIVTFRAKWTGARTASLQIADNAAGSPHLVSLSGTGVVQFSISPVSLTFPTTTVGTSSSVQTVTVTNSIRPPASIGSIAISGTNGGDFKQTNTCTTSLDGLASCQINVTFKPAGVGSKSAILSIIDGDPANPQIVNLSGTGQ
jgi:uncharacterized protein (TIGR03437 family)